MVAAHHRSPAHLSSSHTLHTLRTLQVQAAPAAKKQVPTPNPDPLAGLAPPPANLPPGLSTLNLTQLAPLLPLLANINATVVASWVPVLEAVNGSALAAWAPVLNLLSNSTVEAALAALPSINVSMVLELVPAINALNASMLEGYIKVLGQVGWLLLLAGMAAPSSLQALPAGSAAVGAAAPAAGLRQRAGTQGTASSWKPNFGAACLVLSKAVHPLTAAAHSIATYRLPLQSAPPACSDIAHHATP